MARDEGQNSVAEHRLVVVGLPTSTHPRDGQVTGLERDEGVTPGRRRGMAS